jgi:general secretion pathway protein D
MVDVEPKLGPRPSLSSGTKQPAMSLSSTARLLFLPIAVLVPLLLTACIEPSTHSEISDTLNKVSFQPPPPAPPGLTNPSGTATTTPPEARLQPQIYEGRPESSRPVAATAQRSGDGVQLNFEQAEIRDVIKVILGDTLGRSYTVDSDVQGQVTLSSTAPMAESDLLAVLETVLRANGATLTEAAPNTYRIMPVDAAIGRTQVVPLGGRPVQVRPGYGITIVPLRNISATSAAQFIQPLVASPEDIRIDPGRNAILFSGTGVERQNVLDTLADLDVDWMAGKSIGLFPLQRANAEAVLPELQAVFAPFDPTGAEPSLIRFLALSRLNAILAIAGDPKEVREVGDWVMRLDRGQTAGVQFYVYYLKHAAAEEVAKLLNEAFSEGASSQAGPTLASASAGLGGAPPANEDGEPNPSPAPGQPPTGASTGSSTSNGPVKVVASKANNSLLIRATPTDYERVEATLARLDTAPWQVLIEASIAEVTLNDQLRYGVQYFLQQNSLAAGFVSGAQTALLPNPITPGFNFLFTPGSSNITIDALSRLTSVKILSSPSVVVQDNSEAVLTVGSEVPTQTQQQQSTISVNAPIVNSIEYRNTGVILQVRPRINSNQAVSLEIAQEVSRVDETGSSSSANNGLTPTFIQRKITSRVNVQSGQTVVLGGLIQDSEERGRDRIPVVGDIPVIGNLFGTTASRNQRTELIVFLTPRVMRNPEDARDVSEELRSRLRSLQPVAQGSPVPPAPYAPQPGGRPPGAMPEPQVLVPPRGQQQPQPQLYGIEPAPGGR